MADLVKGNNEIPQTDSHWFSEAGVIDVFFMLGPSAKEVFYQYAQLTGTTNLPHVSLYLIFRNDPKCLDRRVWANEPQSKMLY